MNLERFEPHPYRRLTLLILSALGLVGLLWVGLPKLTVPDLLLILALAGAWIFLGIPACCGFGRR